MGMADLILAGEGDLYDINEYHMLAHLIINKVDDFGTILSQSVHEDVVLYILVLCVSYTGELRYVKLAYLENTTCVEVIVHSRTFPLYFIEFRPCLCRTRL